MFCIKELLEYVDRGGIAIDVEIKSFEIFDNWYYRKLSYAMEYYQSDKHRYELSILRKEFGYDIVDSIVSINGFSSCGNSIIILPNENEDYYNNFSLSDLYDLIKPIYIGPYNHKYMEIKSFQNGIKLLTTPIMFIKVPPYINQILYNKINRFSLMISRFIPVIQVRVGTREIKYSLLIYSKKINKEDGLYLPSGYLFKLMSKNLRSRYIPYSETNEESTKETSDNLDTHKEIHEQDKVVFKIIRLDELETMKEYVSENKIAAMICSIHETNELYVISCCRTGNGGSRAGNYNDITVEYEKDRVFVSKIAKE